MSQAGALSVSSTPSVPTSFVTDSGTATPVANVLNVLGNDTTANNNNGIQTTGSVNTVTVELTNRLQGSSTSVGAVTSDIITFTLSDSVPTVYRFGLMVTGIDTVTGDGVGYEVLATAKTDGAGGAAVATIIASTSIDNDEDTSLVMVDMEFIASGNDVILRATGIAGSTINYSASGTYVQVV